MERTIQMVNYRLISLALTRVKERMILSRNRNYSRLATSSS
ncbi:hypothetical protein DZ11F43_45390 [Escherichia coli]